MKKVVRQRTRKKLKFYWSFNTKIQRFFLKIQEYMYNYYKKIIYNLPGSNCDLIFKKLWN